MKPTSPAQCIASLSPVICPSEHCTIWRLDAHLKQVSIVARLWKYGANRNAEAHRRQQDEGSDDRRAGQAQVPERVSFWLPGLPSAAIHQVDHVSTVQTWWAVGTSIRYLFLEPITLASMVSLHRPSCGVYLAAGAPARSWPGKPGSRQGHTRKMPSVA